MTFKLLGENLAPAEQETTVRTYHCTTLSSGLLRLRAEGYLTVTNKRAVFYAFGHSYAGKSILQSEVPIADISGLNCYKGTYFSLSHLFSAIALSIILSTLINTLLGPIVFFMWTNTQNFSNLSTIERNASAIQSIFWFLSLGSLVCSFFIKRKLIWRSVLASTGALLLVGLSGLSLVTSFLSNVVGGGGGGANPLTGILTFVAVIYTFVCFFWYARRETVSLAIGSKGGSNTPIAISGIGGFGLYNTAAIRALSAEPAADVEAMLKELGAMITDIQTPGNSGIHKWQVLPAAPIDPLLPQPAQGV